MIKTCFSVALLLALVGGTVAQAALIPGLEDGVYHGNGSNPTGPNGGLMDSPTFGGDNPAAVRVAGYAATHAPDYTFNNTNDQFVYGNGSGTATNSFLGGDAAGAALTDSFNVNDTIFDAKGQFLAPVAGTYTASIGNTDDIASVYIGGHGISGSGTNVANSGWQGASPNSSTISLSAGYHTVEIIYGNGYGGANLNALGVGLPGVSIVGPNGQVSYFNTPEPASLVTLGLGGAALLVTQVNRRRRARQVASPSLA